MVWQQLRDNPEVLYGALAALAIVLVLTPAVGRSARYLRIVDRPVEGERTRSTVPRLGGFAALFGLLGPSLPFLPLGGGLPGAVLGPGGARQLGAERDVPFLRCWA